MNAPFIWVSFLKYSGLLNQPHPWGHVDNLTPLPKSGFELSLSGSFQHFKVICRGMDSYSSLLFVDGELSCETDPTFKRYALSWQ